MLPQLSEQPAALIIKKHFYLQENVLELLLISLGLLKLGMCLYSHLPLLWPWLLCLLSFKKLNQPSCQGNFRRRLTVAQFEMEANVPCLILFTKKEWKTASIQAQKGKGNCPLTQRILVGVATWYGAKKGQGQGSRDASRIIVVVDGHRAISTPVPQNWKMCDHPGTVELQHLLRPSRHRQGLEVVDVAVEYLEGYNCL